MSERTVAALGPPVARGGTAELFGWRDGWLLKLFFGSIPVDVAHAEAATARSANAAGLPTPAAGEVVMLDGRPGFPIARLAGRTMAEEMLAGNGSVAEWARTAAKLMARVHAAPAPAIRGNDFWRTLIGRNERLAGPLRERVLTRMESLPPGDRLCHGDFHAGNIFVTSSGPSIIDWGAAHRGNALSDVAQSWVAMTEWLSMPQLVPGRPAIREFIEAFTDGYFQLHPGGREEFEAWKPVVAALRLSTPHPSTSQQPLCELISHGLEGGGSAGLP